MNKYVELIQAATPYATRMTQLRNRIFGDVIRKTDQKSINRVVRRFQIEPFYKKDEIVNYYPRHMAAFHLMHKLREYGLYRDEHRDFQEEQKRMRTLRGKVKTVKGKGKQAMNK